MKILFLAPYPPGEAPSQRYRFEHYLTFLDRKGIQYEYYGFWDARAWKIIFKQDNWGRKLLSLVKGFFKRWIQVFRVHRFDYIYIHREVAPVGPPIFEWIVARLFGKKIIYDFDDAIWVPVVSAQNKIALKLKWFSKTATICNWTYKVSVGNEFLAGFARRYCNNVIIIPTVVDTAIVHNRLKEQDTERIVIGWTGSFSTLKYLDIVLPVLQELENSFDFDFLVIADKDPGLSLKNYRFIKWNKTTEASDLLKMNIGIMPLYDDDISKGKCGFKAIQYMSLGIPALVSPIGVNSVIVDNGVNGFLCPGTTEWKEYLIQLLESAETRKTMGKEAREKIERAYSVHATEKLFMDLFK